MGGSLRRKKKAKPRIVKRKPKKGLLKSKLPEELTATRPDMRQKLGASGDWDAANTVVANYASQNLVCDPNSGFGRNQRLGPIQEKAADEAVLQAELDDDLKAACSLMRSSGKAKPKPLTPHQRQIVQRLIAAHGEDTYAMQMDRKLNSMQHSQGQLAGLIESYNYWKGSTHVGFRAPIKGL